MLDKNRDPLMPCYPARARKLLRNGRAAVFSRYPFTIILLDREGGETQDIQKKNNQTAAEFGFPDIQRKAKKPLRDAAAVNATRWRIFEMFKANGLPLEIGTGTRIKYNRRTQGYPKIHWIDAACVGESGAQVYITPEGINHCYCKHLHRSDGYQYAKGEAASSTR